ncbi:MAG: helix-turn-helix transcriptional regulator [Candidatus Paracaedimonas acanthamoebae]|mgnify:CR=1 FL=1|uniref:Helix-turn-helix transcriptional regulator n=1 Tax=Candidatus Paracaedimonas acanthamoebae TaxID=244581 RepID=A0A8J7TTJ6_9PROT|nr:helix-turn-helix transcriptional regulator [Candidatus Paracaedimonas acanthamoebae]
MVEYKMQYLDNIFHALADPTRRQLLHFMSKSSLCNVTQLAEPFSMSLNAISKHLKVLEHAGLIKRQKKGRMHYLTFNQQPLEEAAELINQLKQHWEARLDSLENYFTSKNQENNHDSTTTCSQKID